MQVATPDIDGFIAAGKRARQTFGDTVTFSVPQPPQWAPGTRINPDTGDPYSAMAVRQNAEHADVAIVVGVVLKQASPLRPQADTHFAPSGVMEGMDIILDVDADDRDSVKDASEFTYAGLHYRLVEWKPFAMGDRLYRWLVYGQER